MITNDRAYLYMSLAFIAWAAFMGYVTGSIVWIL